MKYVEMEQREGLKNRNAVKIPKFNLWGIEHKKREYEEKRHIGIG